MTNKTLRRALASAGIFPVALALAACGSAAAPGSAAVPANSASPGFTGYDWQVVAIGHDGKVTSIPARVRVFFGFSPGGQFLAGDGIRGYSGTYRATSDGFTTGPLAVTADGYAGDDPYIWLGVSAMESLGNPAKYRVSLTGDQLVVDLGSYTLTCHRAGHRADAPAPARTA